MKARAPGVKKEKKKKTKINSIRTSIEGREIAAFEEETLALRRELQEARASRTLAENHAAKCVNFAVSRSVTFDTPCVTSTPVRNALTDTCSLSLSVIPSAISSHTTSVLRSRSAEVAALSLVSEDANHGRNSGPASRDFPRSREDESDRCSETTIAVTCTSEDTVNAMGIESRDKIGKKSSGLADISSALKLKDCPVDLDRKEADIVDVAKGDDKVKLTMTEEEIETRHLTADSSEEQTGNDHQLRGKCANAEMTSIMEKDEARIVVSSSVLEEQKNLPSDTTSKVESTINHPSWQKICTFHNQRGSFKKPRRKNGNLRRSFSETDKNPCQDTKVVTSSSSTNDKTIIGASRDTMSEDEGCCSRSDDRTSRDIIEVPDVAVVSGGSIMPKNLCSTRTPISRTQTAPSRATYTTAYI